MYCLITRLMAYHTPRKFGLVNLLTTNDVLACGPRTPWSPVRGWTRSRPGPVVATRLLDLDDDEPELQAENSSGRGGATRIWRLAGKWGVQI